MVELITDPGASRHVVDLWVDANSRGIACAADGAWPDAADAFSAAVDHAASGEDVASHEALALLLNNLAHARFRSGHVEDAIRHAQRACSLRVALLGEDAIAVSRARSDLAVMLASAGRADEGFALIARAVSAMERIAGDEDVRLVPALENAARLALAAGQPASAEPYLLRLHALLAEHGQSTEQADALLSLVADYRRRADRVPTVDVVADDVTDVADAVAEAAPDTVPEVVADAVAEAAPDVALAVDFELELAPEIVSDDIFGDVTMDLVDELSVLPTASIDLVDEFEVLPPTSSPAALAHNAHSAVTAPDSAHNVLGFTVEYGTPSEDSMATYTLTALPETMTAAPAPEEPSAPALDAALDAAVDVAVSVASFSAVPAPDAPHDAPASPRFTAPAPAPSVAASPAASDDESVERPEERTDKRSALRAGRAAAPRSSRGMIIAGVITLGVAAVAGWMAL